MSLPTNAATALLGAVSLLAGCTGMPPSMAMGAAPNRPAVVRAAPFTAVERDFVMKVAAQGIYEVEVSKLAAERAMNGDVRNFAQAMARQHTQANNELSAIMVAHGMSPPSSLTAAQATKLQRLAALPPSEGFDTGYVRVVGIEDHRTAIDTFEKARRDMQDPQLRDWIERTLGTLRNHLAMAQSLAAAMNG